MSPNSCPYCGAPHRSGNLYWMEWDCRTQADRLDLRGPWTHDQSPECTRYVRVRISQLRRMAHIAYRASIMCRKERDRARMERFLDACLREIDRLRGGA